jgi:hydrogenase maturation factor
MTVVSSDGITATVEGWGEQRVVGALLVGELAPGSVVLVHLRDAVRLLEAEEAAAMTEVLRALTAESVEPAP